MVTTRSRPRGRETARPNDGNAASEHAKTIAASVVIGLALIIALLTLTSIGHTIDLAVQHFMLFYAGVFALIGLCASVGAGLVSTDRMFLHPGQRVMMQSIHRAVSFGAFAFLIIHVVTEILAQRIDVIDAFIPFLQPFKTFYIGLGTIASDIIILLVITGILRKRFAANGKGTWRWRAIHYTNYAAFVFGVWHGLLGGRPGKPYVDWSYGFVVAFVALGIAIRVLSNSLRPKEGLSAPAVAESATSGTAPLRAAMLAQAGSVRRPAPAAMTSGTGGTANMLPSPGAGPGSGPISVMRALPPAPGFGGETIVQAPVYEPGYEGPPRYQGAPRPTVSGPMQAVPSSTISGPLPEMPELPRGGGYSGAPSSGGFRRPATGPMPQAPGAPRAAYGRPAPAPAPAPVVSPPTGGFAGPPSGPVPQAPSGPMPRVPGAPSGAYPRPSAPPPPPPPGYDAGYDGTYEQAPPRHRGPRDPRQAYPGGDHPR